MVFMCSEKPICAGDRYHKDKETWWLLPEQRFMPATSRFRAQLYFHTKPRRLHWQVNNYYKTCSSALQRADDFKGKHRYHKTVYSPPIPPFPEWVIWQWKSENPESDVKIIQLCKETYGLSGTSINTQSPRSWLIKHPQINRIIMVYPPSTATSLWMSCLTAKIQKVTWKLSSFVKKPMAYQ